MLHVCRSAGVEVGLGDMRVEATVTIWGAKAP